MMKNKKGTIILLIILAVQFLIPLSVWGYETYKNKELEEKGQEVKILIDYADYDEHRVEFGADVISEVMIDGNGKHFIVFENNEEVFFTPKQVSDLPETNLYISVNKLYNWYSQDWCLKYESETTKAQNEYDWYRLYNKEIEKDNILKGTCEGHETQAYAVFKIYKNRFKVVNVYIDGMPVDTVIEKYKNNEFDTSRYEYQDYDYDKQAEIDEYYEGIEEFYDVELEEYVTEPVAA